MLEDNVGGGKVGEAHASKKCWIVEMWEEGRELFKELVRHILIFLIFFVGFELLHLLQKKSALPPHQMVIFEGIHFWTVVIVLGIFSIGFIIKVIVFEYRGVK